jgi:hypothetical protein
MFYSTPRVQRRGAHLVRLGRAALLGGRTGSLSQAACSATRATRCSTRKAHSTENNAPSHTAMRKSNIERNDLVLHLNQHCLEASFLHQPFRLVLSKPGDVILLFGRVEVIWKRVIIKCVSMVGVIHADVSGLFPQTCVVKVAHRQNRQQCSQLQKSRTWTKGRISRSLRLFARPNKQTSKQTKQTNQTTNNAATNHARIASATLVRTLFSRHRYCAAGSFLDIQILRGWVILRGSFS